MKSKFIFLFTFFIFVFQSNIPVYSQNHTPELYTEDEFPAFMYDLRRAEIITLGSMPFITLGTSLGYSFGKYAYHGFDANYFSNPFAKLKVDNTNINKTNKINVNIFLRLLTFILYHNNINIIYENVFHFHENVIIIFINFLLFFISNIQCCLRCKHLMIFTFFH